MSTTASFAEIRAIVAHMPPCDPPACDQALSTLPPRIAIFAAAHGVSGDLPGAGEDALRREITAIISGSDAMKGAIEAVGGELRLYELAIDRPSRDFRVAPAMDEIECCRAAAYGMMAVEPGFGALAISALGAGGDLAAAAIGCALAPGALRLPDDETRGRIAAGLARHGAISDPLVLLTALGGPDIAAMMGVILAAGMARIPVILDGIAAQAAALVAVALRPGTIDHCRLATDLGPGPVSLAPHLPLRACLSAPLPPPEAGIAALASLLTG